jgi:hypothetical protein
MPRASRGSAPRAVPAGRTWMTGTRSISLPRLTPDAGRRTPDAGRRTPDAGRHRHEAVMRQHLGHRADHTLQRQRCRMQKAELRVAILARQTRRAEQGEVGGAAFRGGPGRRSPPVHPPRYWPRASRSGRRSGGKSSAAGVSRSNSSRVPVSGGHRAAPGNARAVRPPRPSRAPPLPRLGSQGLPVCTAGSIATAFLVAQGCGPNDPGPAPARRGNPRCGALPLIGDMVWDGGCCGEGLQQGPRMGGGRGGSCIPLRPRRRVHTRDVAPRMQTG